MQFAKGIIGSNFPQTFLKSKISLEFIQNSFGNLITSDSLGFSDQGYSFSEFSGGIPGAIQTEFDNLGLVGSSFTQAAMSLVYFSSQSNTTQSIIQNSMIQMKMEC